MRVVHLVMSNVFAGIEQHVNELIDEQQKDCETFLICNSEISDKFNTKNILIIKNFSRRSPFNILKLLINIKKLNVDILHTHGSKTTIIANIIVKFLKIKHVSTMHGIKKKTAIYKRASKTIVVSNLANQTIDNQGIVIKNWWSPNLPKEINSTREYAVAIGRLEKVKGFDLLIKSWVGIQSKLVIIGGGNEYKTLKDLIVTTNLQDKITIVNDLPFEELINYYSKASILIVSSLNEGGPRVALEALYLKIPVISTNVGHMSEILPQELLAKPNSLESLKELIHSYVGNININQDAIFKYVNEEYSITKQSNKIIDIYKELLVS